jgi:hypothetical protein
MSIAIAEMADRRRSLSAAHKVALLRTLIVELDGPAAADAERACVAAQAGRPLWMNPAGHEFVG